MTPSTEANVLRVLAVLYALRSITNILKPFGSGTGLVFFGKLLGSGGTAVLAPALGLYMLVYAYGLWNMRRFSLPMGIAYAGLAAINVTLFPVLQPLAEIFREWQLSSAVIALLYGGYAVVGAGIPIATVWLLWRRQADLR